MVDDIKNILISLNQIRLSRMSLDDQESTLKQRLLDYFKSSDMSKFNVSHEGKNIRATQVNNDRVIIDELGLIENISPEQYDKIIKKSVDRKLLEIAISNGDISEDLAKQFIKVQAGKKYIKLNVEEDK